VVVVGKPSAQLAERLEKDEKDRIAKQVENLGPVGLKQAAALLENSKAEHDKPIPKEVLTSFPVPDVKSISWIPVQSVQEPGVGRKSKSTITHSPELSRLVESDGPPLPFFVEYDSVKVRPSDQSPFYLISNPLVRFCDSSCVLFHGQNPGSFTTVSRVVKPAYSNLIKKPGISQHISRASSPYLWFAPQAKSFLMKMWLTNLMMRQSLTRSLLEFQMLSRKISV
jgi:hypothetical protein